MKLFKTLIVGFTFISSNYVMGQNTFSEGFVVTYNNDTIRGFIATDARDNNKTQCEFRSQETSESKIYTTSEIKSFQVNDKYFVAKEVNLDNKDQVLFLEYLLDGIVDLYCLNHFSKSCYYVEKENRLIELSNEDNIREGEDGRLYKSKTNQYKGVLKYTFKECPELASSINSTSFSHNSLVGITKKYHNQVCDDYKCIDYTKTIKRKIYLEPQIGLATNWLKIKAAPERAFDLSPCIGSNLKIVSNRTNMAWGLKVGIHYSVSSFEGTFTNNNIMHENTKKLKFEISNALIKIPFLVEYEIRKGNLIPFINVGYQHSWLIDPDYTVTQIYLNYNGNYYENANPIPIEYSKFQLGGMIGSGFKRMFKNNSYLRTSLNFEIRIPSSRSGNVTDYHYVSTMQFSLSYGFSIR